MLLIPPALAAPPQAPIATLQVHVDRQDIEAGEAIELTWTSTLCTEVILQPLGQRLPPMGHLALRPPESITYWLSASNASGGQVRPLEIRVRAKAEPALAPPPSSLTSPAWIQLEAHTNQGQAERRKAQLSQQLGESVVLQEATPTQGRTVYRLRLGPFTDPKVARAHLKERAAVIKGLSPLVTIH